MAKFFKCFIVLLLIIGVFGGAMYALNLHTGPIIEQNNAGAANDRLNSVMAGGTGYEDITATLGTLPETVVAVHKEKSGLGFVIEAKATSQYTGGDAMDILIGVSPDGKISGIKLVSHSESLIFGEEYPDSYIGKDSALSGVEVYAGSTFSSKAFKGAVEAALNLLIDNNLISAGVKTPEQILTEMIATVAPELASAQKGEGKGDILTTYTSGSNAAYIVADGEDRYLAVITDGVCKLYDVEGNDVTESKADIAKKASDYAEFAANERINQMLEGASGFEDITATLKDVPASVVKIHKETSGLGFVIEAQATSDYTGGAAMDILIGVAADGKIASIKLVSHSESKIFDEAYLETYVGQDSALAGVDIFAGVTFSSKAFKGAVEESLGVLISNELITAGVKSDDQILSEMIETVAPGFVKVSEVPASGNITKAIKAGNDAGFAYIVKSGDANFLAVVNAMGVCKVYNVAGEDVTAANEAVVTEAKAHASASQKAFQTAADTKFGKMIEGATDITPIAVDTFNSVVYAVQFKVEDATYYGFYSRSFGFDQMDVYIVIDENGAIVKVDAVQFIFHEEYFGTFAGMPDGYKDGFIGVTEDTFGDQYIIATATMTSNAVKQSTEDAFACFNTLNDGGNA